MHKREATAAGYHAQTRTMGFANASVYDCVAFATSCPRNMISTAPFAPITAICADGQLRSTGHVV